MLGNSILRDRHVTRQSCLSQFCGRGDVGLHEHNPPEGLLLPALHRGLQPHARQHNRHLQGGRPARLGLGVRHGVRVSLECGSSP